MSTEYIEEYELPTRGYLYVEDDIPAEVSLRSMKAKEEKMLLGSVGRGVFNKVISACVTDPKQLNMGKLILPDKYFLLMKLRILSFGNKYYAEFKCPNCNETPEFEIDLEEDLEVFYLDESFEEPFEVELPVKEDIVGMKFLRDKDMRKIDRRARKIKRRAQSKQDVGNIEYILRLARRLVTINGEEIEPNRRKAYIEDLNTRDTSYIKYYLNNEVRIGYDLEIFEVCPYCGEEVEFDLPMTEEFFRTRFND